MAERYEFAVVGGGIVGLATAMALARRGVSRIVVLEKEPVWAFHQTGHNSGVIHSGIYYAPGSLKARMARQGNRSMVDFCARHEIRHQITGKLIVATREEERPRLDELARRAAVNGVRATPVDEAGIRKVEPHATGIAALHVPDAGIVDYRAVCAAMADEVGDRGATLLVSTRVIGFEPAGDRVRLKTTGGSIESDYVIACSGLQSDRVAMMEGVDPGVRIVPFRGEYWELRPEKQSLVRGLVYPVPDPALPFLGVHLTKMVDGRVLVGPNAILALSREGYGRWSFDVRDVADELLFKGTWKIARRLFAIGASEMFRAASRAVFLREVRRLLPEVGDDDLVRAPSGIRAQAVARDGALVDDFMIARGDRTLHVCNAPSPAATASIEIGEEIAARAEREGWLGPPRFPRSNPID